MEVIDPDKNAGQSGRQPVQEKRRFVLTGLCVLILGGVLLYDNTGHQIPDWVLSWEMILITVGIFIGEKHRFSNPTFFIPIAIGLIFLSNDIWPDLSFKNYIWPIALIIIGFALIIRPRRVWNREHMHRYNEHRKRRNEKMESYYETPAINSGEDYLDSVSIFGSTKKNIMSKNFRGGEATSFFGGTELNLMQADIQGDVVLELTQVFGGCKLIIPSHWELKSELVNIFGGTEDKRPTYNVTTDHTKVLVIRGTSIFGGIEIRSF